VGKCWEGGERTRKEIYKKVWGNFVLFGLCEAFFWWLNSANVDVVVSESEHASKQGNMGQVCCCMCVEQAKVGIVEKFGKYERIAEPGCQCVNWICGHRLAGYISLRVQQLDVRCETKTKVSYNVHAVQHCVHCVLVFVCTHMIYFGFAACCRCVVELYFGPKLFSVARFPLIFSVVDDAFARQSFLLCDASVSWINEFKKKERKKERREPLKNCQ
jgi:hypothetical protein